MSKINVMVTGIGGGGHGEQILKALKISNLDLFILGTDITENSSGKRYVDEFCKIPRATNPEYREILASLVKKHNIRFLFHGSEPELKFMNENRDILASLGVEHPLNSEEIISLCMNKYNTYKKLENLGFELPAFYKVASLEDIEQIKTFPVVLKPNTSSGGSSNVFIAIDREELELTTKLMLKRGIDIVCQKYVYSPNDEYTIGISSDSSGKILGSVAVKRFITNALSTMLSVRDKDGKSYVISSGVSQGLVCQDKKLCEEAEKIAKALNSKGPLNIQCRYKDGKLMLFEINPRLSGTTSLRAMAGYNEPEQMIRQKLLGLPWQSDVEEKIIMRSLEEVII